MRFQAVAQEKAAFGGEADAECLDGLLVEAALLQQVFARAGAFGRVQLLGEEFGGAVVHLEQGAAQAGFFGLVRTAELLFGEGHAELLGDDADGLGEGDVLDLLDEGEDVAGLAAAETVEELPRLVDGEGGGLLLVEGAESGPVLRARLFETHIVADDADDVRLFFERGCEVAGRHGGNSI